MDIFDQSIAQLRWPKERVSTNLCPKCGDCFQLDLHELKFDETLHSVRSGYSPDCAERPVYSKLMADVLRDVDRCQSELRRLQDLSNTLEEQQELLLMYMAGVRSIISPIHKLPEEILVEIFKYVCCDDIGANCILPNDKKRLPTLTLSRVCIQWYNLVTSTPVLWSSFGTQDLDSCHNPSLFKVFLERSHLHPIDFAICDFTSFLDDTSESPSDTLSSATASDRWRRVNIHASKFFVQPLLQPLIARRQNLAVLVSLSIQSEIPDPIAFPIACPNLQKLTLSGVALEFQDPLPAVTHLNLDGLTPEEASRLISRCPNVQDITLITLTSLLGSMAPPMTSCNTQKLTTQFQAFRNNIKEFLHSMDFPELVHLELSASNTQNTENLRPLLERSHRHLTHLSLHSIKLPPDELLHLFLCVPTVTVLDLEESPTLSGAHTFGVYLVLQALIVPLQQNQLEEPVWDRDSDEVTADSEDRFDEEDEGELVCDDGEDEESLDLGDKARNIEVFKGRCLLPRLKELDLIIRPRNKLLLQLVRSRWRPSLLLVPSNDDSNSGACACLQTLRIKYPGVTGMRALARLRMLEKSLYRFEKAGMVVDVLK